MIAQPLIGAGYLLQGFRLIRRREVLPYVAIPVAINVAVFAALGWYAVDALGPLVDWIVPDGYAWLSWLVWPLAGLAVLVLLFYLCTLLANVIAAPFNGPLAAAVEAHLTGSAPVSGGGGLPAVVRGTTEALRSEARKLGYYLVRAIPLLVLAWIPVVNLAVPFLWLALNTWMLALEYADYPMGNHGLGFAEQRARLGTKPLVAFGFGGAALGLTLIPVLNFIAVPTAVAGATAWWVNELRQ
ncbi:MAG: sulfate transporter CysZ [Nitrospirota bacterium]